MIKAVVFDMDGVLFDTEHISSIAWDLIAKKMGIDGIYETLLRCIGLNRLDGLAVLRDRYGTDFPAENFLDEARSEITRIIEEEGIPLKPGVREILAYLKERRIPVALCSSTRVESIQSHLKRAQLTEYFQVIVGGDMVVHSKPEPDIYFMACKALGMEPQDCIAVEDSPNGLRAANRAGLMTVMVPDLVAPTPELLSLCFRQEDSLLGLLAYLKSQFDVQIRLYQGDESELWQTEGAALLGEVFPHCYSGENGQKQMQSLREEERVLLGAFQNGHLVGLVGSIPSYDFGWELHPLAIKKENQRQRIGSCLIQALEDELRSRGVLTLYLGTDDEKGQTSLGGADLYDHLWERIQGIQNLHDHPFEFYQKMGYQIVGVLPDVNGAGKPDIWMAKRL